MEEGGWYSRGRTKPLLDMKDQRCAQCRRGVINPSRQFLRGRLYHLEVFRKVFRFCDDAGTKSGEVFESTSMPDCRVHDRRFLGFDIGGAPCTH